MPKRSVYMSHPFIIGNDPQSRSATQQRHRNAYNIHWKRLSCYVKASEGFLQSKITWIGRF